MKKLNLKVFEKVLKDLTRASLKAFKYRFQNRALVLEKNLGNFITKKKCMDTFSLSFHFLENGKKYIWSNIKMQASIIKKRLSKFFVT